MRGHNWVDSAPAPPRPPEPGRGATSLSRLPGVLVLKLQGQPVVGAELVTAVLAFPPAGRALLSGRPNSPGA